MKIGSFALAFAAASSAFFASVACEAQVHRQSYASPQHFALELRFSPYTPQIDSEPGLKGKPYETTFGTMQRVLVGGEFDWQALRIPHFGSIGPGLGLSYTDMAATATLIRDGSASGDETSLEIWSTYAAAVLRVDVLWRDFNIPIVPYAKAGLGLGLWRASSSGSTSEATTASGPISGLGHTWGTHVALGGALALDVLDRASSTNLDQATGINSTYLFGEYYFSMLNGIGQDTALRVGANTWAVGLAFEF